MVSGWEQPHEDVVEIEVEARPVRSRLSPRSDGVAPSPLESVRRGALVLRALAYVIAATSALGYILLSFWDGGDGDGLGDGSLRPRVGSLLMFVWGPWAIAGLVYTASLLVTLYAARIELDARRLDAGLRVPARGPERTHPSPGDHTP